MQAFRRECHPAIPTQPNLHPAVRSRGQVRSYQSQSVEEYRHQGWQATEQDRRPEQDETEGRDTDAALDRASRRYRTIDARSSRLAHDPVRGDLTRRGHVHGRSYTSFELWKSEVMEGAHKTPIPGFPQLFRLPPGFHTTSQLLSSEYGPDTTDDPHRGGQRVFG